MKRNLLLFIISSILLFFISCKDDKSDTTATQTDSTTNKSLTDTWRLPKLDAKNAKDIIGNAKNLIKIKDTAWTKFNRKELIDALNLSTSDSVKFFIGAFVADNGLKKKNYPIVILQLKSAGFVDGFLYYEGSTVCPPPDNCPCESND